MALFLLAIRHGDHSQSFIPLKQIVQAMRAQTRGRRPVDESVLIDVAAMTRSNQLTTAISNVADNVRAPLWPGQGVFTADRTENSICIMTWCILRLV